MPIYFCDSLKDISIVNGVARLEFQRLEPHPGAGDDRNLRAVVEFAVAMPIQGLAQTINLLEGVRDRLVRDGVFRTGGLEPGTTPPSAPADRSPNF
jgi:hypothetical protein